MKFLSIKTEKGKITGKISFYCRVLGVSRQGFYEYLKNLEKPWKYEELAAEMMEIIAEDKCNDTYGYVRMYQALKLRSDGSKKIPSERTIYRIMCEIGIIHTPKRKPKGITKADKEAQKSNDLLKRDFRAEAPLKKCVTDMTEIKTADGKLYVSAIFDCYDNAVIGIAMADNMKAELCVQTVRNAYKSYPEMVGCIIHSDRGSQYTSSQYREIISKYNIKQSMNSAGGRCHDNAKCESMWGRMKDELLYKRLKTEEMGMEEVKTEIWRYYMSYWNNRRICSANDGLPPMVKRKQYYDTMEKLA